MDRNVPSQTPTSEPDVTDAAASGRARTRGARERAEAVRAPAAHRARARARAHLRPDQPTTAATGTPRKASSRSIPAGPGRGRWRCRSSAGPTRASRSATSARWPRTSPPPSASAPTTATSSRSTPPASPSPPSRASTAWCRPSRPARGPRARADGAPRRGRRPPGRARPARGRARGLTVSASEDPGAEPAGRVHLRRVRPGHPLRPGAAGAHSRDRPRPTWWFASGTSRTCPSAPPAGDGLLSMTAGEARLYWPDVGAFLLRHGREITLDPRPGVARGPAAPLPAGTGARRSSSTSADSSSSTRAP